jgi:hypothetical protein
MTQTAYPPSTIEQERLHKRVAELEQGDAKMVEILGGESTHKIPREIKQWRLPVAEAQSRGVLTCRDENGSDTDGYD